MELRQASGMDLNQYRGVWVFAEQHERQLRKVTLELLGIGRCLADALTTELGAIIPGDAVGELTTKLIEHGADTVFLADNPELGNYQTEIYTSVITSQVLEYKPEILLFGATAIGRDLAPRVARRIGTGLVADCTELAIDTEKRLLLQTKPSFVAGLMFTFVCPNHRPQMATVRPGVMEELDADDSRRGKVIQVPVHIEERDRRVKVVDRGKEKGVRSGVDPAEARIVVTGGRGMGSAEGFRMVEELAQVLGGAAGATRDPVEDDWCSGDCLIGQTGKTVKPELYIACGVSGAGQHVVGITGSKVIVAINDNPEVEIFRVADYGIVGDVHEVIPALIKEIKKVRNSGI